MGYCWLFVNGWESLGGRMGCNSPDRHPDVDVGELQQTSCKWEGMVPEHQNRRAAVFAERVAVDCGGTEKSNPQQVNPRSE